MGSVLVGSQFPIELDWLSLILGIIGTALGLVGVLTLPQVIWGGARVLITFGDRHLQGSKALMCVITNPPETRRVLQRLVQRAAAEGVIVSVEIVESGTMKSVVPFRGVALSDDTDGRFSLPASVAGRRFPLIVIGLDGTTRLSLDDDYESEGTIIPQGKYACEISAMAGNTSYRAVREFVVGANAESTYWIPLR